MQFQTGTSGNLNGAPTKYHNQFNEQAYKLALLGATDAELAEFFGVCEATLNKWKIKYPLFVESIHNGKVRADADVAHKLYDRAIGAKWIEQAAFKVRNQTESGVFTEEVVIVDLERGAPPDTQAISLWLRNRKSTLWKDKVDINHGGQEDNPILVAPAEIQQRTTKLLEKAANRITVIENDVAT